MRSVLLTLLFLLLNVSDSFAQCWNDSCPNPGFRFSAPVDVFQPADFAYVKIMGDRYCDYGEPQRPFKAIAGLRTWANVIYEDWTAPRLARRYDCECYTVLAGCNYGAEAWTSCPAGMIDDQPNACDYRSSDTEDTLIVPGERFGPSFDPYLDTKEFAQEACDELCQGYGESFREAATKLYCQDPPLPELLRDVEIQCSGSLRALNETPNTVVTDIVMPAR